MWRVFDHDTPSNLENILEDEGFEKIDSVTLVVLTIDDYEPEKTELDVRELSEASQLQDFISVTESAFAEPSKVDIEHHARLLAYPNFKYYVAYSDNRPVASARFEIPDQSRFGLFFGGCVVPEYRGKGFYKALVNARFTEAKKMGLKYISTEARVSSRPILEKLGFKALAYGRTWELIPSS
jgi:GNAT superfamily N-acetyltransferase